MARIEWDDSLAINFREIDRQHKRLVDMINKLDDAVRQEENKETLGRIINDLLVYTRTHFRVEEKYFDEYGYPDAERHKREHALFIQQVNSFKNEFQQGKSGLSEKILDFLSDWLNRHIKNTDMRYGPFFREREMAATT